MDGNKNAEVTMNLILEAGFRAQLADEKTDPVADPAAPG